MIQTIKGTSASMASMIAEAATGGGTYITVASAWVASFAYRVINLSLNQNIVLL